MKFLLDTHVFLWLEDHAPLSPRVREILADSQNTIFLSYISLWEVQIKLTIGKLQGNLPIQERVQVVQARSGLKLLPIEPSHIFHVTELPLYHRDPFDRMLIAQALVEGLPLLSKDVKFQQYPIEVVW